MLPLSVLDIRNVSNIYRSDSASLSPTIEMWTQLFFQSIWWPQPFHSNIFICSIFYSDLFLVGLLSLVLKELPLVRFPCSDGKNVCMRKLISAPNMRFPWFFRIVNQSQTKLFSTSLKAKERKIFKSIRWRSTLLGYLLNCYYWKIAARDRSSGRTHHFDSTRPRLMFCSIW